MTIRRGFVVLVCAVTFATAPSFGAAQVQSSKGNQGKRQGSSSLPEKKDSVLHFRGTLVEGGAECQRFRTSNNKFYTLSGDLRGFRTGDHVEIIGRVPQVSHCMQDTTIQVETIRQYKAPDSHTHQQGKKPVTASSKPFLSP